jgi:hypothetical protein
MSMRFNLHLALAVSAAALVLSGCAAQGTQPASDAQTAAVPAATGTGVGGGPPSRRSLASFAKANGPAACYDREKEPFTAVVDAHFHPRPFGGPAIPPWELYKYFDEAGVRFVNYFGIGQVLDLKSGCTYYLDCPGVPALPSIKNDFVNGMEVVAYPHENLHITLSMTFMDLAHPEDVVRTIELYDKEYPGMFKWAGELNVMKQALLGNLAEPATMESIERWGPFMKVLRERGIPVTLHSDLGNDAEPTKFVPLAMKVFGTYPDNKIVWAHMGLSKELSHIDPELHISMMKKALDLYPNLMLDISWDVLYENYREFGPMFVEFFNQYPDRILPGTDFVAAGTKDYAKYAHELDVTSRVNKALSDEAFRKIALGENYFRLLGLPYEAPQVCKKSS